MGETFHVGVDSRGVHAHPALRIPLNYVPNIIFQSYGLRPSTKRPRTILDAVVVCFHSIKRSNVPMHPLQKTERMKNKSLNVFKNRAPRLQQTINTKYRQEGYKHKYSHLGYYHHHLILPTQKQPKTTRSNDTPAIVLSRSLP